MVSDEKVIVNRWKIQFFLSKNFHVAEAFAGQPGSLRSN